MRLSVIKYQGIFLYKITNFLSVMIVSTIIILSERCKLDLSYVLILQIEFIYETYCSCIDSNLPSYECATDPNYLPTYNEYLKSRSCVMQLQEENINDEQMMCRKIVCPCVITLCGMLVSLLLVTSLFLYFYFDDFYCKLFLYLIFISMTFSCIFIILGWHYVNHTY